MVIHNSEIASLISKEITQTLADISRLTVVLRHESDQKISWDESNFAVLGVYPIIYKLLVNQRTLEDDGIKSTAGELCRLGGLLFIAEVRRKFGLHPIIIQAQIEKLQRLFNLTPYVWNPSLNALRTWVLVVAGCAVGNEAGRAWIVKALVTPREIAPPSWQYIIGVVSEMWWIEEVFCSRSKELQSEYMSAVQAL
jgi:hypothetical protein